MDAGSDLVLFIHYITQWAILALTITEMFSQTWSLVRQFGINSPLNGIMLFRVPLVKEKSPTLQKGVFIHLMNAFIYAITNV